MLPWLDYDGQTTEELLALGETHRLDSLVVAFDQAIQMKGESTITPEERVVLAIEAMEREVNNGGFHQFITNSTHEFAPEIADALKRIGATVAASLAEQAVAALHLEHVTAEAIYDAAS